MIISSTARAALHALSASAVQQGRVLDHCPWCTWAVLMLGSYSLHCLFLLVLTKDQSAWSLRIS